MPNGMDTLLTIDSVMFVNTPQKVYGSESFTTLDYGHFKSPLSLLLSRSSLWFVRISKMVECLVLSVVTRSKELTAARRSQGAILIYGGALICMIYPTNEEHAPR
jgi:hypothetical protein